MITTLQSDSHDPFPLAYASIDVYHKAMQEGHLTSVQLVEYMLERIARWDQKGPCLKALLALNPRALDLAREKDSVLASEGLSGPLHGIPVVVKDNSNTSDMPTTAASTSLEGFVPSKNSTAVQRLLDAGAIILAKSNLHEFAQGGMTVSSLGGQTLNPYDLTRTCGGSSGGSAVALAMDFCTIALGTDTVNSIRSPSSAANLVGLRPTRGLLSRAGWVPVAETQDVIGPMGRNIRDVARTLDVLAGYDAADPVTAWSVGHIPASYLDELGEVSLKGRRLGLLTTLYGTDAVHEPVNLAMENVVDVLTREGAVCVPVADDHLDADTLLGEYDVQRWEFNTLLQAYLDQEPQAPVSSLEDIIASGRYHESIHNFFIQAREVEHPLDDAEYLKRKFVHQQLRDRVLNLMANNQLDALIYPLQKRLVVPVDAPSQVDRNGILAALTGLPALNLPAGFSAPDSHAPLGVPMGFDMLGRPFDEPLLLGMGYAYEQSTDLKRPPQTDHWPV